MDSKFYGTRLYINYSKLAYNVNFLKHHVNGANIIAMVKANAYGHGDIFITKKLQSLGISRFGVADFDEGIRLRNQGVNCSIMVMNPSSSNIRLILENDLEPVIHNASTLSMLIQLIQKEKLNQILSRRTISIHIKLNTGMNRWGFDVSEVSKIIQLLEKIKSVKIKSVYSHLSSSKNIKDDAFTIHQINQFSNVENSLKTKINYNINYHIFNSAALLRKFKFDPSHLLRTGILLYGAINNKNLRCIAELRCAISDIRTVSSGSTIGYQRSHKVVKKTKIGILPFGYADGLQRQWGKGQLKFLYNDKFLPTVGEISMDSCIIDLSEAGDISVGDDVIYFGEKRPIWDLAKELNTIPYEIISTLSRRIKRVYN